jgi:hypothetical protein
MPGDGGCRSWPRALAARAQGRSARRSAALLARGRSARGGERTHGSAIGTTATDLLPRVARRLRWPLGIDAEALSGIDDARDEELHTTGRCASASTAVWTSPRLAETMHVGMPLVALAMIELDEARGRDGRQTFVDEWGRVIGAVAG